MQKPSEKLHRATHVKMPYKELSRRSRSRRVSTPSTKDSGLTSSLPLCLYIQATIAGSFTFTKTLAPRHLRPHLPQKCGPNRTRRPHYGCKSGVLVVLSPYLTPSPAHPGSYSLHGAISLRCTMPSCAIRMMQAFRHRRFCP